MAGLKAKSKPSRVFSPRKPARRRRRLNFLWFPACDLVLDKQGEELTVSEFVVDGFLVSGRQCLEDAGKTQSFEHGGQVQASGSFCWPPVFLSEEGCGIATETSLSRIG